MEFKRLSLVVFVIGCAAAQNYRVCISSNSPSLCQSLEMGNSAAACLSVESRIDCALKLSRGEADIGYFSEEEVLLMAQQQPESSRVVATVRDVNRLEPYAFEAVAVVAYNHTGGLEGLRGGYYCHPGLDEVDQRWSPRVLKAFEQAAAQTDRCNDIDTNGKSADQIELETLSGFFSAACRPGTWSANETQDSNLKNQHTSMCSLCGGNCSGYSIDMGVSVAGARNENHHIQALECLRVNTNASAPAVAYSAWLHVREYFTIRNPQDAATYSLLCPNGTLVALTAEVLNNATSPCAFVRQPWGAVVSSTNSAAAVLSNLRNWWPNGSSPGGSSWQSVLFTVLAGGANARVVFQDAPVSVANYTTPIRPIPGIDATSACLPARRWCTLSAAEQTKCAWVRAAAHTLGIQPALSCQQRASIFECLRDIRDDRADFISSPSNYGFLARQHYKLTPVKMVQNQRAAASRVAAFVKESSALNITRFENLRGGKACFPEFSGLAYVAFVRAAQERGVLSATECDYGKAVGEFFSGACAPGAEDASHTLLDSTYDASTLCSVCKPANSTAGTNSTNSICTYDYTNKYYGNNGSLACLADPETDVAFLNTQNIAAHLTELGLQGSQFRALCRNNTLAATTGVNIDDGCVLAYVVDAEVITRRNDPLYNSLNVLFDTLDHYFGYNAAIGTQLINLEIFSAFDGISNLLFKDSTIGLAEPTLDSNHEPAKNYIELFQHLQACTGSATPVGGSSAPFYSMVSLVVLSVMARFIVN